MATARIKSSRRRARITAPTSGSAHIGRIPITRASDASAGVKPLSLLRGGAALLPLLLIVAGCGGSAHPVLMDGTKPGPLPAGLARILHDATLTRVAVTHLTSSAPTTIRTCVTAF